jgi:hypothetical protein
MLSVSGLYSAQERVINERGADDNGNRNIRRKPTPVLLCPPTLLFDLAWHQNRAVAVGSRLVTKHIDSNIVSVEWRILASNYSNTIIVFLDRKYISVFQVTLCDSIK